MRAVTSVPAVLFLALAGALSGCESSQHMHGKGAGMVDRAIVVLAPTEGNDVTGSVTFTQQGDMVQVEAHVEGLTPNAQHAWHIHEFGDLSSSDGTATGGHYNPEGHDHGLPPDRHRHAGDFGNLKTDSDGHAHMILLVDNITIFGTHNPVIGRAIIVHAAPDDGGQPTGNAGPRIAQGVIGVARSE